MRTTISIMTALALVSAVNAQEKQPGSLEVEKLMERARQAKEAGRYEEAQHLAVEARQIEHEQKMEKGQKIDKGPPVEKKHHEESGGKGPEDKMAKVHQQIEELNRAGKHEEVEQLKRHVAEAMEHKKGPPPMDKKGPPMKEGEGPARLRHLMEAIHHLREAGINEPADSLEKMAHQMKEEFEHREHLDKGRKPEPGPKDGPPHKGDKPRGPGDELHALREQMEKMAHAIEDLRAQIKGHGEEEVRKPRKE